MINCYTKNNDIKMSKKLFIEMQDKGIQPDIVCMTSMIHAYAKNKNYKEAWELHYQVREATHLYGDLDETFYGVMLDVCAYTHEAEKAINFYE